MFPHHPPLSLSRGFKSTAHEYLFVSPETVSQHRHAIQRERGEKIWRMPDKWGEICSAIAEWQDRKRWRMTGNEGEMCSAVGPTRWRRKYGINKQHIHVWRCRQRRRQMKGKMRWMEPCKDSLFILLRMWCSQSCLSLPLLIWILSSLSYSNNSNI
jgi:hypothetical protein